MRILMLVQITAAAAAAVDADSVACLPAATFYPVSIENLIDSTRNKSPHTYTHIQATHTLSAISKDNTKSKSNQRQSMHNNSHFKLQPMTKLYELILLFIRICTRSKYTFRHTHRFFVCCWGCCRCYAGISVNSAHLWGSWYADSHLGSFSLYTFASAKFTFTSLDWILSWSSNTKITRMHFCTTIYAFHVNRIYICEMQHFSDLEVKVES